MKKVKRLLDTSNVTDMNRMFYSCPNLTTIKTSKKSVTVTTELPATFTNEAAATLFFN